MVNRNIRRGCWRRFLPGILLCGWLVLSLGTAYLAYRQMEDFVIVVDPGHGGDSLGAQATHNGVTVYEKDLNFQIALFLQEELQQYRTPAGEKIRVFLTHRDEEGTPPSLKQRVGMGKRKHADLVLSLHNNSSADGSGQYRGAMVLVTASRSSSLYQIEQELGLSILRQLQAIGQVVSQDAEGEIVFSDASGLLRRRADDGTTYPNGDAADWYGIVEHGVRMGVPAILVEHAYMDNAADYQQFLGSEQGLRRLAQADARGLASYYGWVYCEPL